MNWITWTELEINEKSRIWTDDRIQLDFSLLFISIWMCLDLAEAWACNSQGMLKSFKTVSNWCRLFISGFDSLKTRDVHQCNWSQLHLVMSMGQKEGGKKEHTKMLSLLWDDTIQINQS